MNALLIQDVLDEEIKLAAFQHGSLKAPGPDGFPGVHDGRLFGLKIRRGCPTLSHLFFADDAVIFVKANQAECLEIGKLLQIYGQATRQSINFDKSGVQFSGNVSRLRWLEVCGFLGILQMQANAKYLGLPSCWGRSKAEAYNFLCEKVLSKLQGWKANGKVIQKGAIFIGLAGINSVCQNVMEAWVFGIFGPSTALSSSSRLEINSWIPSNPSFRVQSERPRGVLVQKVHEVIDSSRKLWNESQLRSLVSGVDCDDILSIPVSVTDKDDTLLWHHDSKGCYTIKSGYREAVKQAHLNLSSRRCAVSACYPVCFSASESIEHLLFDCEWSRRVWFGCDLGLRCNNRDRFSARERFGKCFETLGTSAWGKSVLCSMVWVAWTIWKGRNDHLFNHHQVDPSGVIAKAKRDEAEFLASCLATLTPQIGASGMNSGCSSWFPPPRGLWKFNCDAAVDLKHGMGTVVVLLRDHTGQLVDGMVRTTRLRFVVQCELLAIRHACLMADALNLTTAEIESDCKSVIQLCVSEGVPPWELLALICDVRSLASHRSLVFRWCPRQANRAAHWVASAFFRNSLPLNWVTQPPMGLIRCLFPTSI
ncbi:uncharacterized protein LOC114260082 [Camellia sinensis]|uniref:uncharacterized protein LOC114260082 n=1 Tax=Camellia sinensis TaxID=4442 RepID=UPI001036314D|nr:uncharacterized protein LOC114260082 [Camellia sinensis]